MKKTAILVLLICAVCISLWGCGSEPAAQDTFDAQKDGIVKLILQDAETEELVYLTIGPEGRSAETEEFESAALTALFAEGNCFLSSVRDGKVCNEVAQEVFFDETGAQVIPDAAALAALALTAELHDRPILSLTVITCSGYRFPLVELEGDKEPLVILYYFNTQTEGMTELYRFTNMAVGGMQIVNPDNLP